MIEEGCGHACNCFKVLFLNSICVIKPVANMTPKGSMKNDMGYHDQLKSLSQMPGEMVEEYKRSNLTIRPIKMIRGINSAPTIVSHDAALLRRLSHSLSKL